MSSQVIRSPISEDVIHSLPWQAEPVGDVVHCGDTGLPTVRVYL